MNIENMTTAAVTNAKTMFWNKAWSDVHQGVIAAGGSMRAANKARVEYLAALGCTEIKIGRYSQVKWDNEKFGLHLLTAWPYNNTIDRFNPSLSYNPLYPAAYMAGRGIFMIDRKDSEPP